MPFVPLTAPPTPLSLQTMFIRLVFTRSRPVRSERVGGSVRLLTLLNPGSAFPVPLPQGPN